MIFSCEKIFTGIGERKSDRDAIVIWRGWLTALQFKKLQAEEPSHGLALRPVVYNELSVIAMIFLERTKTYTGILAKLRYLSSDLSPVII